MRSWAIIFLLLLLVGCQPHTPDEYRREGERLMNTLSQELEQINSREELVKEQGRLSLLFMQIAKLAVRAQEDLDRQVTVGGGIASCNAELNERLRQQLIRIYKIEGGREIIEEAQKKAVIQLIHSDVR
jgi:hypothetical protein